jgi:ethanolamine utilization microcompartment shell protein EutL
MALTLQERVNLAKGIAMAQLATTPVTNVEKIDAQLKKLAGEIVAGTLLPADIPSYSTFNPTAAQLAEWCNRVLDSVGMSMRMVPMIISYNQWDTDGAEILDAPVRTTCIACIAAQAAKI